MNIKLKPDITTNIVRTWNGIGRRWPKPDLNIHYRDAKRIMRGKIWNSRKIRSEGDSFVAVTIHQNILDDYGRKWLLHLEDLKNGETRVTPMYEIEFVRHSHRDGHKNYIVFKKKALYNK